VDVTEPALVTSVIVPTRDRPDRLRRCLEALERQTARGFEVVVVDDGSVDGRATADVVARWAHARLVVGTGRGPAAARNVGAAAAAGRLLCFTDDDCRPEPGWLDAIAGSVARGADVVAGPTSTALVGNPWSVASQTITNYLMDESRDDARGTTGFAPTSNVACRAEVWRAVPFDDRYPSAAGEDRDWCARLSEHGVAVRVEPGARVWHDQDLTLRTFWRQQVRYGRGALRFHHRTGTGRGLQPVRFYTGLIRAGFAHGAVVGLLVLLAQVATAWGVIAEAVSTRRQRA
jgi:glycosyltransferase involved in cell wall biosynthesis